MPKSEIDDIFAGKADPPIASSSVVQEKKKKKKKKAKDKDAGQANTDEPPVQTAAKRRLPETVVDTSAKLEAPPAKRAKVERSSAVAPSDVSKKKKGKKADKDEEADFRDSRGTGPRRTTEEGFSIYKEDELGISHEGGDTPLCPFDCDCCF